MHVTEVDNGSYDGRGHIKFNSKTFDKYGGALLKKETNRKLKGEEGFQFEAGGYIGGKLDFILDNGPIDEDKTFKPLNEAKFYILSN